MERFDSLGREVIEGNRFLSGRGGLASTKRDYLAFADMLLRGGVHRDVRLLGTRTVAFMARNHLPGGVDLGGFGRPVFAEMPMTGISFGLGFSVVVDPVGYGVTSSIGEFGWGGAASTTFLIDPKEEISAVFMTRLIPSNTYPIRSESRALLYSVLVD